MSPSRKWRACTSVSHLQLPTHVLVLSRLCRQIRLYQGEKMVQPFIRPYVETSNCARLLGPLRKITSCASCQMGAYSRLQLIVFQQGIVQQKVSVFADCCY